MTTAALAPPLGIPTGLRRSAPWALLTALVGSTIAYPLTDGSARLAVTWVTVLLGASLSVAHAAGSRGWRTAAGLLGTTATVAVAFEAVGLATGVPYGEYRYAAGLGPTVAEVPFLVPLAWLMMAWPSWLLAARLAGRRTARTGLAAAVFAGWDVVLDPQMVQAGYWQWAHPSPGLPGIDTVPLTNLAGWLLAGGVLMALLSGLADRPARTSDLAPLVGMGWMVLGGALAHVGWLGLPGSAAWGLGLAVLVLAGWGWRARR